ncbi:hypothetical protein HDU67_006233 [Dinochytrium kinnereticum]|nr:hypothetical protein HDU67_006233 [Dinochytrium kinnereticum]
MRLVSASLIVAAASVASVSAAVDPLASVPEVGQYGRFRALPRGSNLALSPVDGAEFVPGQRFDISIELHSEDFSKVPDLSKLEFTVNGADAAAVLSAPKPHASLYNTTYFKDATARHSRRSTTATVARLNWRDLAIPKSGKYEISIKAGAEEVKATWTVRGSSTRKAKNVVLFVGDGMATSMISAARYIAKNTRFGKFESGEGFFSFEKFSSIGKISTNGIDSIMTDSANSAAAFHNGQKSFVNALNVYGDTTPSTLDDTKVEVLASMIRRKLPDMCIGVVTTAAVWDATPAAVFSYTRSRSDEGVIVDQNLRGFSNVVLEGSAYVNNTKEDIKWSAPPVKADVILGGGGSAFCSAKGCKSFNGADQYAAYKANGYAVVNDGDDMTKYAGSDPLVGIFHIGTMSTWYDRVVETNNLESPNANPLGNGDKALKQPGLEEMTMKAIEVMEKRCKDGYFLMSEAASIDKQMHPIDFDRGLADLLELDRTVQAVVDHDTKKETLIVVTSDHAQGYDVYGTVDLEYMRKASNDDSTDIRGAPNNVTNRPINFKTEKRQAIGVYDAAGWPSSVVDSNGLPTLFKDQSIKLASGKIDSPTHVENFEHKDTPRSPTNRNQGVYAFQDATNPVVVRNYYTANDKEVAAGGIYMSGNLPQGQGSTVHTLQAVDLYCQGPGSERCGKVLDNTEVFFIMADALGLGDTPDDVPPTSQCPAATATATATTTITVTATATVPAGGDYNGKPIATAGPAAGGDYSNDAKPVSTASPVDNSDYIKAKPIVPSTTAAGLKSKVDGGNLYQNAGESVRVKGVAFVMAVVMAFAAL